MRLVVAGAGGRMGRTLVKAISEMPGVALSGALENAGSPLLGADAGQLAGLGGNGVMLTADTKAALAAADALVDFTVPAASVLLAETAAATGVAHVIGTTGFSPEQDAAIAAAGRRCAIVKSGNMSLGVNLLAALTKRVARTLGDDFDIEIVETHHNRKIDAPSGTALLLGEAAAAGRGIDLRESSDRGRDGITGARKRGTIGFAALRGGTVVGEHTVLFAGPAERIELTHKAEDRMLFARGAVKAALWTRGRAAGVYSMLDVLDLKDF